MFKWARKMFHDLMFCYLQDHLQNLWIWRLLQRGCLQLLYLVLDVLDGHLDGLEHHLLPVHHLDSRLHVGEVVGGRQDGLALMLLVQVAVGAALRSERRGEDEADCAKRIFSTKY